MNLDDDFSFPFQPYQIQVNFMKKLFDVLDNQKLGIFESPTGTGKSLSLICGALTWLTYFEDKHIDDLKTKINEISQDQDDQDDDDWIASSSKKVEQDKQRDQLKAELKFLIDKAQKIQEMKKQLNNRTSNHISDYVQDDDFIDDYQIKRELQSLKSGLSADEFNDILDDYHSDDEDETDPYDPNAQDKPVDYSLRIIYCSRTHSQLSQFVKEVQKTKFAQDLRLVSLASRANMCINDSVLALKNPTLINEKCLEMQKKKSSKKSEDSSPPKKKAKTSTCACPYKKSEVINKLKIKTLMDVHDIEELVTKGRELKACPYYASRQAVQDAQVVVVPYNTLLHQATREACQINLDNSVVIIDEAHNLLETIASIHSGEVYESHLTLAKDQLKSYDRKYGAMFNPRNKLYIKQLMYVIGKLTFLLRTKDSSLMLFGDFISQMDLVQVDLFKLIKYIEKSKLCYKLQSYSKRASKTDTKEKKTGVSAFLANMKQDKPQEPDKKIEAKPDAASSTSCPMLYIVAFLQALVKPNSELRVLIDQKKKSIKVILLNPASQFKELVSKCRSIIVAGGTMQPMSEFENQLFLATGAPKARIDSFTCDHIVSKDNVLPLIIKAGPSNQTLDFTFQHRDKVSTYEELASTLIQICKSVPGGMVVFFPSYDYESRVFEYFQKHGKIDTIETTKKVFREPRKTMEMEQVLKDYSRQAKLGQGALLLSVVGGKMSEGINFGDNLGRAVVMVGLPFPNKDSPELKQKMAYLNQTVAPNAGQLHYENLCMKAVNQSIGRAIRHKDDYATMILLDHRYERSNIVGHLPSWIRGQVQVIPKFQYVRDKLETFFKIRRSCENTK